jgi:hypothetical protein
LDSVPTLFNAAARLGNVQRSSRSRILTSEGWKPGVGGDSHAASQHKDILQGKADQSLALTDAVAVGSGGSSSGDDSMAGGSAGNVHDPASGRWGAAAQMQSNFATWGMECLTMAVDRGLVCAEEYEVRPASGAAALAMFQFNVSLPNRIQPSTDPLILHVL